MTECVVCSTNSTSRCNSELTSAPRSTESSKSSDSTTLSSCYELAGRMLNWSLLSIFGAGRRQSGESSISIFQSVRHKIDFSVGRNACWNTLTALTLTRTDQFLAASDSGRIVAQAIIDEMNSIAKALGHDVEPEYLNSLIERDQIKNGIYSSMAQDACANRPMEVEVG